MEPLRQLCCGTMNYPGRLTDVLSILGNVIERYGEKTLSIVKNGSDDDKCMYGSFVARKLLESASSAILARMDPTRFLILQEYQQRAGTSYRPDERHPAAISWSGDIIPDKASNGVWNSESTPDKFVRALLGGHLAEVAWSNAIDRFFVDESLASQSAWIEQLSDMYDKFDTKSSSVDAPNRNAGSSVLGVLRSKAQAIYSSLSKGVHLEFVVDETVVLDPETVVEHMLNATLLVSQLGFLSNYMDSVFTKIEPELAANFLLNIEKSFTQ